MSIAVVVCTVGTALVFAIPPAHFGYPLPDAAFFLAAIASASSLSLAVLFWVRHKRSFELSDYILALAFAITTPLEAVLPLFPVVARSSLTAVFWSLVGARLVTVIGLVAAARANRVLRRPVALQTLVLTAASSALALGLATALFPASLPTAVDDETNQTAALLHSGVYRGIRVLCAVGLLIAALAFARRAIRRADHMSAWIAVGSVALAASCLHEFLFPSMHADWLTTADLLRVAGRLVLVTAAIDELARVWQKRVTRARMSERRRIASELHDGLAQELAFLTMHTPTDSDRLPDAEQVRQLHVAAERALAEARHAIREYSRAGSASLARIVSGIAADIERRFDCRIVLDLQDVDVDEYTAHELERLAYEALTNACRHAVSNQVTVIVECDPATIRIRVTDDGRGFTPDALRDRPHDFHYGLDSMRNRAARLGAIMHIDSRPGKGTIVAVEMPRR